MSQGNPDPRPRGCSVGVVLLSLATCVVLLCVIPNALWLPFGAFYASFGQREDVSHRFPNALAYAVWPVLGVLAAFNLGWMIYALCRWRTVPSEPVAPPPIPEGATDHFMKQKPQVRPEDGVARDP
jgi:hypothetical protein